MITQSVSMTKFVLFLSGMSFMAVGAFAPPQVNEPRTLVTAAKAVPELKTFVQLVHNAGLEDAWSGKTEITLFAPTNAAFEKLDKQVLADLSKPENKEKLVRLLNNHGTKGSLQPDQLVAKKSIKTLSDLELAVTSENNATKVGTGKLAKGQHAADNGVLYLIDTVQMPTEKPAAPGA